jgi:hypothetical protein
VILNLLSKEGVTSFPYKVNPAEDQEKNESYFQEEESTKKVESFRDKPDDALQDEEEEIQEVEEKFLPSITMKNSLNSTERSSISKNVIDETCFLSVLNRFPTIKTSSEQFLLSNEACILLSTGIQEYLLTLVKSYILKKVYYHRINNTIDSQERHTKIQLFHEKQSLKYHPTTATTTATSTAALVTPTKMIQDHHHHPLHNSQKVHQIRSIQPLTLSPSLTVNKLKEDYSEKKGAILLTPTKPSRMIMTIAGLKEGQNQKKKTTHVTPSTPILEKTKQMMIDSKHLHHHHHPHHHYEHSLERNDSSDLKTSSPDISPPKHPLQERKQQRQYTLLSYEAVFIKSLLFEEEMKCRRLLKSYKKMEEMKASNENNNHHGFEEVEEEEQEEEDDLSSLKTNTLQQCEVSKDDILQGIIVSFHDYPDILTMKLLPEFIKKHKLLSAVK